jgi:hypothetical protein
VKTFHDKVAAWIKTAQQYTKFWVAVVGGVLVIITGELALDDEVVRYIRIGIAVLTAFSVYRFPNVPTDGGDE